MSCPNPCCPNGICKKRYDFEEELSRRNFLREQASFLHQEDICYQKLQDYLENIKNETMGDLHNIYECDNMDENEFY